MYHIQKSILRDPDSFLYTISSLYVSFPFILLLQRRLIGGFSSITSLLRLQQIFIGNCNTIILIPLSLSSYSVYV